MLWQGFCYDNTTSLDVCAGQMHDQILTILKRKEVVRGDTNTKMTDQKPKSPQMTYILIKKFFLRGGRGRVWGHRPSWIWPCRTGVL